MKHRLGTGPPRNITVEGSAKVNLGWRVGQRRPDGYHDVGGLIQTLSLCDTLIIEVGHAAGSYVEEVDGIEVGLTVRGPEATPELEGAGNLVLEAARLLARTGEPPVTSISLNKDIPVAAGLGGGSADAAAALLGLATAWGAHRQLPDLMRMAAELGSDVPAILLGGLVCVGGRGERVRAVGCGDGFALVLGVPDCRLSTADVYGRFDEIGGDPGDSLHANDLQPAAISLDPLVGAGLEALSSAGADPVFVSGSGPVVAGVVADPDRADDVAQACRDRFRRVIVTRPAASGVRMTVGSRR